MSLRQVLTIYNAERQLNEDDTALLNTLRRLKDADRELLVQELSDKPQKKSSKKSSTKSGSKSARGESLRSAITNRRGAGDDNRQQEQPDVVNDDLDPGLCIVGIDSKGETCDQPADANVHHLNTHPDYHEFNAGKSDAQSAAGGL